MLVIVIMGIMLGLGLNFMRSNDNELESCARNIAHTISTARAEAVLSREKVVVDVDRGRFTLCLKDETRTVEPLSNDMSLLFCTEDMRTSYKARLLFGPSGVGGEYLLLLARDSQVISLYIPAMGNAIIRAGEYSMQDMRKTLLQDM